MSGTVPRARQVSRDELVQALDRLQASGRWTPEQASALLAELDREPATAAPGPARRPPLSSRLAEAAAYAGAILVAAAGALLVGQQWEELGRTGRIAVLAGLTAVLGAVGAAVALVRPGGRRVLLDGRHAMRRRLASTSLTAAAATGAGTAALVVPDHGFLAAAIAAVGIAGLTQWAAPSAVSETAALAALAMLGAAVLDEAGNPPMWTVVLTLTAVGVGWATLAWSAVLTQPSLGMALGLGLAVWAGASALFAGEGADLATGIVVLGALTVGGLVGYVRTGRWPLAAAGVGALALLVLRIGTDSVGPVLALLLTGAVLLGGGALLLLRRRPRS